MSTNVAASPKSDASVGDVSTSSETSTSSKRRGTSVRRFLSGRRNKNQVKVINSSNSPSPSPKRGSSGKKSSVSSPPPSPPKTPSKEKESAQEITAALAFESPAPTVSATDTPSDRELDEAASAAAKESTPVSSTETDPKEGGSWLTRTQTFKRMCKHAFEMIDTDGSGDVDEKELYSGLLLIHLKLGMYAGPAACRPLGRERCHKVFQKFDRDHNGTLNRHEFEGVMKILFSNVLFRVLVQWSMTIVIVPIVAKFVLERFYDTVELVYWVITNADEYSSVANSIELTIEGAVAWIWERTPLWMVRVVETVVKWWEAVPDSVWNAAPLALISTVLGILVVPWIIIKVDDFFQWLAMREEPEDIVTDNALRHSALAAARASKKDNPTKESVPEESRADGSTPVEEEKQESNPHLSATKKYL